MTSPGEVYAQMSRGAIQAFSNLTADELEEYKSAVEIIANKYNHIDERLSGFNAKGKLSMIEKIVEDPKFTYK